MRYNRTFDSTGIRLAGEPLLPGETQEPIDGDRLDIDATKLPQVMKDGFSLPEYTELTQNFYRYEINLEQDAFVRYAKSIGATPAILLALLVSGSINKRYPEAEKPVVCSMAMDYRNEVDCPNTHKNCVGSIYLPYTNDIKDLPLSEQAALCRQIMKEQRSSDSINSMVNGQIGLFEKLEEFKSLAEKQKMMEFFNDMCINTYVISYLGQMQFGECTQYVETVHLYNSGVNGLRINMISSGDYITVDILQNWESEGFINGFLRTLNETGISYTTSRRIPFSTTKDKSYVTAGKQSERFYKKEQPITYNI